MISAALAGAALFPAGLPGGFSPRGPAPAFPPSGVVPFAVFLALVFPDFALAKIVLPGPLEAASSWLGTPVTPRLGAHSLQISLFIYGVVETVCKRRHRFAGQA